MTGGALLIAGTGSDVGKSVLTAGLCRSLARRGISVAPFKAQNMALNAAVTADGVEIGRAQAMQAAACELEPLAAMNPVLLKPGGNGRTQVVVRGRVLGDDDARGYQRRKSALREVVTAAFDELRGRHQVVICEGAGSPAEINLRPADLANLGLARTRDVPVVVVGDIDRGGVFAALHGTLALLERADQALVSGFVVNRFRGDPAVLAPGLDQLGALTGRRVYGVVPYLEGPLIDAEDSLALGSHRRDPGPPLGRDRLDVALMRLPYASNWTDVDPVAVEPGVTVTVTADAGVLAGADLVVVPGTKATVSDLAWLREHRLDVVLADRARRRAPTLAICGGCQMLGERIDDEVESGSGVTAGLGLLPVATRFAADTRLPRVAGHSSLFAAPATGYEIHHGRLTGPDGAVWLTAEDGRAGGWAADAVLGTSWHGLLESDQLRRALLSWVADRRGKAFRAGVVDYAEVRAARLDAFADAVDTHLDVAALDRLIADGAPPGLPLIPPAGVLPASVASEPLTLDEAAS